MKVVLGGAFGNLGFEILKALINQGHEVVAADLNERPDNGLEGSYTFKHIDVTDKTTLEGLCDGADVVISTIGLTTSSPRFNNYDIDLNGNIALLDEAKRAGVKTFNYISVLTCQCKAASKIAMFRAKAMFENELRASGLNYVIYRPTGYFYDILKVFKPYVDKGEMMLVKGYHHVKANPVHCPDFAEFITQHMNDEKAIFNVGGTETYTYEQMTKMCFKAAGKRPAVKDTPLFAFNILANLPKMRKEGKHDVLLFSKYNLSHDLVGKDIVGDTSFSEYIKEYFKSEEN